MRSGPAPARTDASPVTAPGTPTKKPQTYAYYTRTHPEHKPRVSSSLLRGLRYAILFELVGAALVIGTWVLVGFLATHLPNLILGLCIVALGVMFGAMLAVKA